MKRPARALWMLLLAPACGAPAPRVPAGITVVKETTPPPSPDLIRAAQEKLQRAGTYSGAVDGELTPATRVALAQFQRAAKLPVTGTLDPRTVAALGLPPVQAGETVEGAEQRTAAQAPQSHAEDLLGETAARPLPQPPHGSLPNAYATAHDLLDRASAHATQVLQSGIAAPVGTRQAQAGLLDARAQAFEVVLEARIQGGFSPLPGILVVALENRLATRALLVRGQDGVLGEDDAAAIRWVERSLGLPVTGRPSLRLLEDLGIDPGPMFVAP